MVARVEPGAQRLPIGTPRLRLRRLVPGDLAAEHAIRSRPEVTAGSTGPQAKDNARERRSSACMARPVEIGLMLAVELEAS